MNLLTSIFGWLFRWRRDKAVDKRDTTRLLADELDNLANLMAEVLSVTAPNGKIQPDRLPELDLMRKRVWNRWVSILGTSGDATQDAEVQAEIKKCIQIAHAAPGTYVEEVYLIQIGLAEGYIPAEIRSRFASSIHSLQDLTTRMRLDA